MIGIFRLAFVFLVFIFSACTSDKAIPKDVLSPEKMKPILWDMIRMDELASGFIAKDSAKKLNEESVKLYEQVFALHKISKDQFFRSFRFYQSHPEMARPLFDSLSSWANARRAEVYKPGAPLPTERSPADTFMRRLHSKDTSKRQSEESVAPAQ